MNPSMKNDHLAFLSGETVNFKNEEQRQKKRKAKTINMHFKRKSNFLLKTWKNINKNDLNKSSLSRK